MKEPRVPLSQQVGSTTNGEPPAVSVVITTYNSARYVAEALESVLMQETSFGVEVLVTDDCSKDETATILRDYERRYPGIIRLILREKNVGMQRNYFGGFEESRGRYIAWLDSDDRWTDPMKLTLQVEALDADPTIVMCGHYVRWVARDAEGTIQRERFPEVAPGRHGLRSILRSNFMPSPSIMFRNGLQRRLPEWYFDVAPLSDWPLHVVAAMNGDILLVDRVMADYMLNTSSAFWGEGTMFWHQQNIGFYDRILTLVPKEFRRQVRSEKGRRYEAIAYMVRKSGDFVASRQAAMKAFRTPAIFDNVGSKTKSLIAALVREGQWRVGGKKAKA